MADVREKRSERDARGAGAPEGNRPRLIVLTAPSGAGKTTIARRVMDTIPNLRFSVSATTRPPRSYEREGIDYHFLDPERFRGYIDEGRLVEYEEVYPGIYYGTLREEVERATKDAPILLDIDVRGATEVKRLFGDDVLVIFVRPPSFQDLESRLRDRATEDDAGLSARLHRARKELEYADRFDAVVVNDEVERAVSETLGLIRQFLNG